MSVLRFQQPCPAFTDRRGTICPRLCARDRNIGGACAEAGIDSGIIDPVASDLGRVFAADRGTEGYRLAADMLLGRDPFGGEYVAAFREGRLGAE